MVARWDAIAEGDWLPALEKTPGLSELVKYAAGSGDFNPLHFDRDHPQARDLGSIIVHGRFKYAALGQLVSDWLQHAGRIKKISCQYRGMDLPGRTMTCRGRIARKWERDGDRLVEIELWIENADGARTTPGYALVAFD